MKKIYYLILIIASFLQIKVLAHSQYRIGAEKNFFFTYSELQELATVNDLRPELFDKLASVFHNPLEGQNNFPAKRFLHKDPRTGRKHFRVTHWNLERGYKLKELDLALNNTPKYLKENDIDPKKPIKKELFLADTKMLQETHIYSLNEADFGMKRTGYINTVQEFARITKSKYYTYIPEFIEIDDKYLKDPALNKNKYKGYHGNAIVSKYPIVSSRVIELPNCYDWYTRELEKLSFLEKIKRKSAKVFFKAPIISELRRGHRNALVATIDVPNSPEHVTVVTTHFENRCLPKCRKKQLKYLLNELKEIDTPLILSGDFNNSEVSSEPTSVTKVVGRTITDWQVLARTTASWFNPFSFIINPSFLVINTVRKAHDPTVFGLPMFLRNKTADLFWMLINFDFNDGNMFDFSDKKELSYKGRDGKLSNSNQRVAKGFASTFKLMQNNILTHFRFDWIFVKSLRIAGCQDDEDDFEDIKSDCKRFIPAFGRNLRQLNTSFYKNFGEDVTGNIYRDFVLDRLSDHDPITCKILL